MSKTTSAVWFWQRILTPHMSGLAAALAHRGIAVTYVAEHLISDRRACQGWATPECSGFRVELVSSQWEVQALLQAAPADSIHLCQGIRSNGLIGAVQVALTQRNLRQWVVMETVDDSGWQGLLKRLEYQRLFWRFRNSLQGVLATGYRTPEWVVARGVPPPQVFPFAYFLSHVNAVAADCSAGGERFRFLFVGQFIERKRLDLLVEALVLLQKRDFELVVVGSGPLAEPLRIAAEAALPGRVIWIGRLPMVSVPRELSRADCLILPSRHDGWGAVVSEALMVGTPAICSDRCGSAGVVAASGYGGVFRSGDLSTLVVELESTMDKGRLSRPARAALSNWASCLGSDAGAEYLQQILEFRAGATSVRPSAPWL